MRPDQAGDEARDEAEREQHEHPANNPHDTSPALSGIVGRCGRPAGGRRRAPRGRHVRTLDRRSRARRCRSSRRSASTGTRLDPWVDAYAARTRGLTASQVRALFAVASRPEVVSLAGGMPFVSALPLDAIADTVARLIRDRGAGRAAVRLGPGRRDAARADPRGDGAGRRARAPRRHRGHGRLADGARPRGARVLRPGRRRARRGADLRDGARRVLGVPVRGRARARWTSEGMRPDALREAIAAGARAGPDAQADLHDPVVPQPRPASRRVRPAAPRCSRSRARTGSCCSRTTPTACSASTAPCRARSAPTRPRAWSTSARSPRRSPPACASAGRWRRTACARSSCWPTRPRRCARRTSRSSRSPSTSPPSRGSTR